MIAQAMYDALLGKIPDGGLDANPNLGGSCEGGVPVFMDAGTSSADAGQTTSPDSGDGSISPSLDGGSSPPSADAASIPPSPEGGSSPPTFDGGSTTGTTTPSQSSSGCAVAPALTSTAWTGWGLGLVALACRRRRCAQ